MFSECCLSCYLSIMQKRVFFYIIQNNSWVSLNPGVSDSDYWSWFLNLAINHAEEGSSLTMKKGEIHLHELRVRTTSPAPSRYRLPSFRIFTDVEGKLKLSNIWQLFHGLYISATERDGNLLEARSTYNLSVFVRARLWQSAMLFSSMLVWNMQ